MYTPCGIDRVCNSTEQNSSKEKREIERKEKKGGDKEGEWIESNYFLFTLIPCVSTSVLLDKISDNPEERHTATNTHTHALGLIFFYIHKKENKTNNTKQIMGFNSNLSS